MNQVQLKTHYSAAELVAMQLTGIPTSKVGIRDRAERECWPVHNVTGIGGTRKQYMPPACIMAQIRAKAAAQLAAAVQPPSLPTPPQQLPLLETEAQALVGRNTYVYDPNLDQVVWQEDITHVDL